jgi:hypothetical protein
MNDKTPKVFNTMPNCANTLERFYNPEIETVRKLKFYTPNEESLFTLRTLKNFRSNVETSKSIQKFKGKICVKKILKLRTL